MSSGKSLVLTSKECSAVTVVHTAVTAGSVKLLATGLDQTAISTPWLPTLSSPVK